jgi:hypothetical protein
MSPNIPDTLSLQGNRDHHTVLVNMSKKGEEDKAKGGKISNRVLHVTTSSGRMTSSRPHYLGRYGGLCDLRMPRFMGQLKPNATFDES